MADLCRTMEHVTAVARPRLAARRGTGGGVMVRRLSVASLDSGAESPVYGEEPLASVDGEDPAAKAPWGGGGGRWRAVGAESRWWGVDRHRDRTVAGGCYHLGDRRMSLQDLHDGLVSLLHDAQLHQHRSPSLRPSESTSKSSIRQQVERICPRRGVTRLSRPDTDQTPDVRVLLY